MGDRINTLHRQGSKQGTNIDKEKVEMIRDAILEATRERGVIAKQHLSPETKGPTS